MFHSVMLIFFNCHQNVNKICYSYKNLQEVILYECILSMWNHEWNLIPGSVDTEDQVMVPVW